MKEQSIDSCVTELNYVVNSFLYLREHTHTQTNNRKTRHVSLSFSTQQQKASYLVTVTKKGRRGHGAVATGDHDADPSFHERDGEIDDLRTLLIDRQRSDGHDGFLIDHL